MRRGAWLLAAPLRGATNAPVRFAAAAPLTRCGHAPAVVAAHRACSSTPAVTLEADPSQATAKSQRELLEQEVCTLVHEAIPGPSGTDIAKLLSECKQPRELHKIVRDLILPHPMMHDVMNGHGFRVHIMSKLMTACTRLGDLEQFFDVCVVARRLGFVLSRAYVALLIESMKKFILVRFMKEGRNPDIAQRALFRMRQLRQFCAEDGVPYDMPMHTREVFVAKTLAGVYDRQNLYRASFPNDDVPRREGIVVDWVVPHERAADWDTIVPLLDTFVNEIIQRTKDAHISPSFSFMSRLADYYFSVDDYRRMLAVVEDCGALGIDVQEATYGKLMQLASSFNIREYPQLMQKYRAGSPVSTLSPPDMSRTMFYYARSGGGEPCPECGEPFNHRNPHLDVWTATPQAMRECNLLHQARVQRGVLEDNRTAPQNRDYSALAFSCWELSVKKSMSWSDVEWRAFLTCCTFSPRGIEAAKLMLETFDRSYWDEFLVAAYIRVLRHGAPETVLSTLKGWLAAGYSLSPLCLQQSLLAVPRIDEQRERTELLEFLAERHEAQSVYSMPYTVRALADFTEELVAFAGGEGALDDAMRREVELMKRLSSLSPRSDHVSVKDSTSDVLPGATKRHHIYRT